MLWLAKDEAERSRGRLLLTVRVIDEEEIEVIKRVLDPRG